DQFFNAEKHPQLRFKSTKVAKSGAEWTFTGTLTIAGITQPFELKAKELGERNHPFIGKPIRAFTATGALDRAAYGMKWNAPLDTGAAYLGERVTIELNIELVRAG
ncbi:MAG: YceI family protein, partial [Archangium sp.]|nr:YceI family protein [Archangium sp.]